MRGEEVYLLNGHYAAIVDHYTSEEAATNENALTISFEIAPLKGAKVLSPKEMMDEGGETYIPEADPSTLRGRFYRDREKY